MTTSATPRPPRLPVAQPAPFPPLPVPPEEPAICLGSECATCGTPSGLPGPRGMSLGPGWQTAQAAMTQAVPPTARPIRREGFQRSFRINEANGRLQTAAAPPRAGKGELLPGFYYNISNLSASEYGFGWTGTFRRKVTQIDASTADLTTETGNVLRYTAKDVSGVYTAPGRAENGLTKNVDGSWTESCPDGFFYEYDSTGRLSQLTNNMGNAWVFNYDAGGRVTSCVSPFSQRTTIVYDVNNKIQQVVDSALRITTFTVTSGELRKITTPELCETQFTYDASLRLKAHVTPGGQRTTFNYDLINRVTSVEQPDGGMVTLAYKAGNVTAVTDARSQIWTTQYDAAHNPLTYIDPLSNRTTMTWSDDRCTAVETIAGITTFTYTTMSYKATQLWSVRNPAQERTTFVYSGDNLQAIQDPLTNLVTQTRDADGNVTAISARVDGVTRVTSYTYDGDGLVTAVENPLNKVTQYTYTAARELSDINDADNKRTTYTYDTANQVTAIKDALGNVTTYTRDKMNRVLTMQNALGNVTSYSYDTNCRLKAVVNPLGKITTTLYTNAGYVEQRIDPLGNRTTFTYDQAGNVTAVTNPLGKITTSVYNTASQRVALVNPLLKRTTFSYDGVHRQRGLENPLGFITTTSYDVASRVKAIQDAEGKITTSTYDANGRLWATENALNKITTYTYNEANELRAIQDARGNIKTLVYDAAGQMTVEQDALNRLTSFGYDDVGRLRYKWDARNIRTTYTYDAVGQNTLQQYQNDPLVTRVYDAIGQLTSVEDAVGPSTFTYDAAGQQTAARYPGGKTISYTYDAAGQRETMVAADAGTFTTSYDAASQLTSVQNPQGDRTTYTYDDAGRRTRKQLANSTITTWVYDDADRVTGIRHETTGGTVISRYTYTYDKVANPKSIDESGSVVSWTYDNIYRLTNELRTGTNTYNTTYTYDDVGNRTVKNFGGTLTSTSYDAVNQITTILAAAGTTTATYDAAGNLRSMKSPTNQLTTRTWNDQNQLKALQLPSGAITTCTYRWDGLRATKVNASATEKFFYDGQNYLLMTDGSNVLQAVNTNEPSDYGNLVSQRQLVASTWIPIYYHYDHLGSTRKITNSAGAAANTYVYNAWGEAIVASEGIGNRFRWVGELGYYHEVEDEDYYVRARYYDISTGRWVSQDPLGANLAYAYSTNLPTARVDPSGLMSIGGGWGWDYYHLGGAIVPVPPFIVPIPVHVVGSFDFHLAYSNTYGFTWGSAPTAGGGPGFGGGFFFGPHVTVTSALRVSDLGGWSSCIGFGYGFPLPQPHSFGFSYLWSGTTYWGVQVASPIPVWLGGGAGGGIFPYDNTYSSFNWLNWRIWPWNWW